MTLLLVVALLSYLYGGTIGDFPVALTFYSPEVASDANKGVCLTLAELGEGVVDTVELICCY